MNLPERRVPEGRRFEVTALLLLALASGCASLSPEQIEEKRREIDATSESTIATLLEKQPEIREIFDQVPGYAVAEMKVTKIPGVGGGGGTGVVVDRRSNKRTYVKISRFEVGAGLGVQAFRAVILFEDPALLERAMTGFWHMSGSGEAAAGDKSAEGKVAGQKGYRTYKMTEAGVAVTATVQLIQAKPFLE